MQTNGAATSAVPTATRAAATPTAVGVGGLIGGVFLGMALLDLSVDTWATAPQSQADRAAFHAQYYTFRAASPIILHALMLLLLLLPLAFIGMVRDHVVPLLRGHRTRTNIIGALHLLAIAGVLTLVIGYVKPAEEAVARAEGGPDAATAQRCWTMHLLLALYNVGMAVFPFQKAQAAEADMADVERAAAYASKRHE